MQDVKSQATEATEHSATILESQTQSMIHVLALVTALWELGESLEPLLHQTGIDQQTRGQCRNDNSSTIIVRFPNCRQFERRYNLSAHVVLVSNACKWVGAESHHPQESFKFKTHFNLCALLVKGIYKAKMDNVKKTKHEL